MDTTSIVLSLTLSIFIGIPSILFLNQIGRTLVGSLFTVQDVELYFGSLLPNEDENFKINIGRFKLIFLKNYLWYKGSCYFLGACFLPFQKKMIRIASTFLAVLVSFGLCYFIIHYNFPKTLRVASILFFALSCLNILSAFLTQGEFIENTGGTVLENSFLFDQNQYEYEEEQQNYSYTGLDLNIDQDSTEVFWLGVTYHNHGEFRKAIPLLERSLDNHAEKSDAALLLLQCYLMIEEYEKAESFLEYLTDETNFNSNNYYNIGCLKAKLKKHDESIYYYDKSLELNDSNDTVFNNRGYSYSIIEEYDKAVSDFDRALELNPKNAFAFNNRGFVKMKLGKLEEGMKDVEKSLEIIPKNSYAYRNLGIYHFEKKQYKIALSYFQKTYQLDKETHLIEEHIRETKAILKRLEEN
ncbi:tetratricopeptide repeat protein [Bernardetia sp. OM2101]|uniref:tetratricopeptide repeat protein n=1 Tax=Bernardetia sp. OM2101 TaxID=3344876 RepID=UPI0035D0FFD2